MFDIIYHLGSPTECAHCGNTIRRGQRAITNGKNEFDTCECEKSYGHGKGVRTETLET